MKYLTRPWLVVLLGALAFGAQAQAEDFRVGFVNTDRIFREASTAKAAQAKLEQEFSRREKDLNDMGAALKAASERFDREAPTLSESQRAQRQKQLIDQDREFQRKRREFGRHPHLQDRPAEVIVDVAPDDSLREQFIERDVAETAIQNTKDFSEHEVGCAAWEHLSLCGTVADRVQVNTERFETSSTGINHIRLDPGRVGTSETLISEAAIRSMYVYYREVMGFRVEGEAQ